MHYQNPFGGVPPTQHVDLLLGKSYYIVKAVYEHLDDIISLNNNETIKFFYEHWETVKNMEDSLPALKNIALNLDELLKAPEYIQQVKNEGAKQIIAIKNAKDQAIEDFNEDIKDTVDSIKNYATSAAYSYRYCSLELVSNQEVPFNKISPTSNIKAGDHIVDTLGNVFLITTVTATNITIGGWLTSLRGPQGLKGDTGTGLNLLGVYGTLDEFLSAHPKGTAGSAYLIKQVDGSENIVYVWDVNTNTWKNAGTLQGNKGEPGQSANEILMDPDPEKYFLQIYGQTTGDIIGSLVVEQSPVLPDPTDSFNNAVK